MPKTYGQTLGDGHPKLAKRYIAENSKNIGENIRPALDVIEHVNDNDLPGMVFLIDFEKAFDKLVWSFIFKTLKQFNFGDDLIRLMKGFTIVYHLVQ